MSFEPITNIRSSDRILQLKPMEGKPVLSSSGITDNRLFTGDTHLHAVMDPSSMLWNYKYEFGVLPQALQGHKFTSFKHILEHATEYFKKRNLAVVGVVD